VQETNMTYELLNRRLAILAAIFAFLGVVLGVVALATNYWTLNVDVVVYNETGSGVIQSNNVTWNVCILSRILKLKKKFFQ
jgi:hypothetical protein